MLSKRSISSASKRWLACATNSSVIARPSTILARCRFNDCSEAMPGRVTRLPSGLVEELHLDAGDLDEVVILQRVRRGADRLAVHGRALRAFDVRDEVALRAAREHR